MKRFLQMVSTGAWLVEQQRGMQLVEVLNRRLEAGSRAEPYLSPEEREANEVRARVNMVPAGAAEGGQGVIAVIPLIGVIMPRGDAMADMSGGGAVNLTRFQSEFRAAASNPNVTAIVIEFDTPGGHVSMVEETANMIRAASKPGRPIHCHGQHLGGVGGVLAGRRLR